MSIKIAYSSLQNINDAVKEVGVKLLSNNNKLVIFFASSNYDQTLISKSMKEEFGDINVIGCSTSGEIISGKMLKNSLVAMSLDDTVIEDSNIQIINNIKQNANITSSFANFESYYANKMNEMDFMEYVGIILIDGMSGAEEKIMEAIGDKTNVTFIGGSAGDDLKFKETYIYANGVTYTNAALLALIKPKKKFAIIKTQSFIPTDKKLVVTQANEALREVVSFNNKPAIEAYAEALNVKVEEVGNYFMSNPVGLMASETEPFVRSPQQVDGTKMKFYCNVLNGMELQILESRDIIKDTKQSIENAVKEYGEIEGLINFNCILRTLELEQENLTKEYSEVFNDIPTIGFSTYGEQYIGHINQTSTILAFLK